jgi:hypothetical protein
MDEWNSKHGRRSWPAALVVLLICAVSAPAGAESAASPADRRITIDREEISCAELFELIADELDLELELDPRVECEQDWIRLRAKPARKILDNLCESGGGTWEVEEGALRIRYDEGSPVHDRGILDLGVTMIRLEPASVTDTLERLERILGTEIVVAEDVETKILLEHEGTAATLLDEICRRAECVWTLVEPDAGEPFVRVERAPGDKE